MVCSKTSEFPQTELHPCNLVKISPWRLLLENRLLPTGSVRLEAGKCWARGGENEVLEWGSVVLGANGDEAGPDAARQKCCLPAVRQGGEAVPGDIPGGHQGSKGHSWQGEDWVRTLIHPQAKSVIARTSWRLPKSMERCSPPAPSSARLGTGDVSSLLPSP